MDPNISSIPAKPIFLVGFMGSGKSVVGAALAAHLARPFIDLDLIIVEDSGRQIHKIIVEDGEQAFRLRESSALEKATQDGQAVVATGGGIVLRDENRQLMNNRGITVWLDAPFDLCWHRILTDGVIRPMAPDRASAIDRYQMRRKMYEEAQLWVEIDDQPVTEIIEIICERLKSTVA